jgi:hypothetical protein
VKVEVEVDEVRVATVRRRWRSGSEGDSDEMCVWRQRKNRASVGALSGDVTSVE